MSVDTPEPTIDPRYAEAKRRVKNLKHFYQHGLAYCLGMAALMLVDYFDGPVVWFHFALIAWSLLLFAHAQRAYGAWRLFGEEWEQTKTQELLGKDTQ